MAWIQSCAVSSDLIERVMTAAGVTVWSMATFEADDALATATVRYADDVDEMRVLTPDKDLGQVLDGDRVTQIDRIRKTTWTAHGFTERRGIPPASLPDYLGLVGDTADGIPGLPGLGRNRRPNCWRPSATSTTSPMTPKRGPPASVGASGWPRP